MTGFALDPAAEGWQDQIVAHLRGLILSGALRPGSAVPSTRTLARDLGVARQTVVLAYARLAAEGYLDGRPGSATRVSEVIPEDLPNREEDQPTTVDRVQPSTAIRLSARGAATAALAATAARPGATILAPGIPALDAFPSRLWERLSAEVWRGRPAGLLGYAEPGGHRPLREAIVGYLGAMRGVACAAEQVIVTSGSQQAIALAAHLLADAGDAAWVEDPAYIAGRHALVSAGLRAVPVPVDAEGLEVERGAALEPRAQIALVTPSHQYPAGAVMSLRCRLALLAWAERAGAWVIEDDYDGEFRYVGRPLQPLAALSERSQRVIYVGTFSKVLAPGLRLGYLVLPPGLVGAFTAARALADRQPPGPEQAVLAEFIARGHLARHVRAMRTLYRTRRDALTDAVTLHAGGLLDVAVPTCGLHAVGYLRDRARSDTEIYDRVLRHGVQTPPLSAYYATREALRPGLLLGFASTPEDRIADAVRTLAALLQR
ncbi:PLP-dependent aminotransferase family protein [Methylobacterium sp. J-070]|uniref:MocR-like pyridoxine biosynthesis transcription factor PdxR n=1 Tax=Methylobacterium sp. J-070 TaxID=2836650 RepID=UPI001FB9C5A0|nr:PLP-dependent aminotransferase family protein [Methylobacterium sp. J-070]MCJ2049472.1 PLP-dependent aminotransferase family protein [Methylobacterium sp. J-070]